MNFSSLQTYFIALFLVTTGAWLGLKPTGFYQTCLILNTMRPLLCFYHCCFCCVFVLNHVQLKCLQLTYNFFWTTAIFPKLFSGLNGHKGLMGIMLPHGYK